MSAVSVALLIVSAAALIMTGVFLFVIVGDAANDWRVRRRRRRTACERWIVIRRNGARTTTSEPFGIRRSR